MFSKLALWVELNLHIGEGLQLIYVGLLLETPFFCLVILTSLHVFYLPVDAEHAAVVAAIGILKEEKSDS